MNDFRTFFSLVEAIDGARSEMEPGDDMRLCQSDTGTCGREGGCSCPTIEHGDPRSTIELVALYYGVRQ